MRLLFIDVTRDYGLFAPLEQPMGGLQSGLCYLTHQLALQGHDVTIANACPEPREEAGVHFIPWSSYWQGGSDFDAIIITAGTGEMLDYWQKLYGRKPLWIFWVHYDIDQHAIQAVKDANANKNLDGFLFVSEWQAKLFRQECGIGWDRAFVLRNAVGPRFLDLFAKDEPVLAAKSADPLLVYTSTPYRGLEPLMNAVPLIQAEIPEARFQIYSSWAVYGKQGEDDPHNELYDRCHNTPGVEYIGSVPQTQLSQAMKSAWVLAYPSVFRETSCIAVMEAMAAGCKVVTSHLAALPETAMGFASLIINPESDADLVRRFADETIRQIRRMRAEPEIAERELRAGVDFAQTQLTWALRAGQLAEWLGARRRLYDHAAQAAQEAAEAEALARPPLPAGSYRSAKVADYSLIFDAADGIIGDTLDVCGEWAAEVLNVLTPVLRPGDCVLDIGAHVGETSLALARAVGETGRVFAFEPQERYFRLLSMNQSLNEIPQLQAINMLIGSGDGRVWGIDADDPADAAWRPFKPLAAGQGGLLGVAIDQLLPNLPYCRMVRISAPFMLDDVLAGMMGLIERCRPALYCEITRASDLVELQRRLWPLGYLLHWNVSDMFRSDNANGVRQCRTAGVGQMNILCIPEDYGLYSPLQPALFVRDMQKMCGERRMPLLINDFPAEAESRSPSAPCGDWRLRAHMTYALTLGHDARRQEAYLLWQDLLDELLIEGQSAYVLARGEGAALTMSAWGLIAKSLQRDARIDGAGRDCFLPKSEMDALGMLLWVSNMEAQPYRFIDGSALLGYEQRYDLVLSTLAEDVEALELVRPGGYLVLDGQTPAAGAEGFSLVREIAGFSLYRKALP